MIEVKDYQEELKSWRIKYRANDLRVELYGGDRKARKHYESILRSNRELEARLLMILTNTNAELKYALEERAAMRYAEGLTGDMYSAALSCVREV